MGYINIGSLLDILHKSRTLCFWDPSWDIWQCLWHPGAFHAFRTSCSTKAFNGWLPLNVFAGWLCPMCVTGTWVSSWSSVIIIWYHYIVICMLATIFNWWLSSKSMKLRVSIKEPLVVFQSHVLHYTALFTCGRASNTVFGTRNDSRIVIRTFIEIHIHLSICLSIYLSIYLYMS